MNNSESLKNKFNTFIEYSYIEYTPDTKNLITLALHSRVLENTKGFISLLEQGNLRGPLYPIIRNSLEALIDLDNLLNKDGYEFYLAYLDLKEIIRGLNKEYFKTRLGAEYESILKKKTKDFEYYENLIIDNYKEFTKTGNQKQKIYIKTRIDEKFKFAGNSKVYDNVYYFLCNYTHNNINSLESHYINDLAVTAFEPLDVDEFTMLSEIMESILIDSVTITEKILKNNFYK